MKNKLPLEYYICKLPIGRSNIKYCTKMYMKISDLLLLINAFLSICNFKAQNYESSFKHLPSGLQSLLSKPNNICYMILITNCSYTAWKCNIYTYINFKTNENNI